MELIHKDHSKDPYECRPKPIPHPKWELLRVISGHIGFNPFFVNISRMGSFLSGGCI